MSLPTDPTPPVRRSGTDSLIADLVIADEGGGTTVFPADPEAFARYAEGVREALRKRAERKKEENKGPGENKGS